MLGCFRKYVLFYMLCFGWQNIFFFHFHAFAQYSKTPYIVFIVFILLKISIIYFNLALFGLDLPIFKEPLTPQKIFSPKLKTRNFSTFHYFRLAPLAHCSFNSVWLYSFMFLWQCRIVSQCGKNFSAIACFLLCHLHRMNKGTEKHKFCWKFKIVLT